MTIEIRDPETIELIRALAARTGHSEELAVEAAVLKALSALDAQGTSYRERRNSRVRARALDAQQSPEPQSA
ncbi:type II toxin-antitoxin system VapB family antitoxin [Demequina aurantiaca]|uniref:type II toxin-antitoxin system VapB family antitoxin n=1 Tax=Demequina aurantiaca TaxID=676200 RepID=UPI0007839C0A|nr:type II toxin-antitoxin system VapB family antitoxin [Demequina aurantiaca]